MIFKPLTEDEWARMSWHAKQRWLLAAATLRRQFQTEIESRLAIERSRAALRDGLMQDALAALAGLLDDEAQDGAMRLWAAAREAEDVSRGRDRSKSPRPSAEVAEDVEWLLEQHPHATPQNIADRLGMSRDAIYTALGPTRADRPDLLARLRGDDVQEIAS